MKQSTYMQNQACVQIMLMTYDSPCIKDRTCGRVQRCQLDLQTTHNGEPQSLITLVNGDFNISLINVRSQLKSLKLS